MKPQGNSSKKINFTKKSKDSEYIAPISVEVTKNNENFQTNNSESNENISSCIKADLSNKCHTDLPKSEQNNVTKQWTQSYSQQEFYIKLKKQHHERMQNLEYGNPSNFFDYPYTNNHHIPLKISKNQHQINNYQYIQVKENHSKHHSQNPINNYNGKNPGIPNKKHSNNFVFNNQKFEKSNQQAKKLLNNPKENMNESQDINNILNRNVIRTFIVYSRIYRVKIIIKNKSILKDSTPKILQELYQENLNKNWGLQKSNQVGYYVQQDHIAHNSYQTSNAFKKISYTTAEANLATSGHQTTYVPLGNIINNNYKMAKSYGHLDNNNRAQHHSIIEKSFHSKKNLNGSSENQFQARKKNDYHKQQNQMNEKIYSSIDSSIKMANMQSNQHVNKFDDYKI